MIEHQIDRPHPARLMYTIIARLPTGSGKRALQESAIYRIQYDDVIVRA